MNYTIALVLAFTSCILSTEIDTDSTGIDESIKPTCTTCTVPCPGGVIDGRLTQQQLEESWPYFLDVGPRFHATIVGAGLRLEEGKGGRWRTVVHAGPNGELKHDTDMIGSYRWTVHSSVPTDYSLCIHEPTEP